MTGPPPAVAELRVAVRAALVGNLAATGHVAEAAGAAGHAIEPAVAHRTAGLAHAAGARAVDMAGVPAGGSSGVLVACSGGADSVALAAATAFVATRLRIRAGLVTVDHGLQDGSRVRAEEVATWARGLGLEPVEVVTVDVPQDGTGPEAAARAARYEALIAAAKRHGVSAILLGHTMDDQAETCLLALARGAGPRGMAGMPERREVDGVWMLRPLLGTSRATTRAAAADSGFTFWDDPHNADPRFARSRVRHELLPALIDALGPGVVGNLAQTARMLATDASYLDELAAIAYRAARVVDPGVALRVDLLVGLHPAIRGRVLHRFALDLGATPAALGHRHVEALDALVTRWRGQGQVWLPGGVAVARVEGRLVCGDGSISP